MTGDLGQARAWSAETEARGRIIARLLIQAGKINARTQYPRSCPSLQTPKLKTKLAQTVGQAQTWSISQTAGRHIDHSHMNASIQKCAAGQKHMPGLKM